MSDFRSGIERAVYLQLQPFAYIRVPIPLFVALAVISGFSIVGRVSSATITAITSALGKTLTKSNPSKRIPFLNSLLVMFTCALSSACLRARIYVKLPIQWRRTYASRGHREACNNNTYATPRAEAKYWRVAGRYRRRLYSGNSTVPSAISAASGADALIPLVTYYTPRLLPLYRDRGGGKRASRRTHADASESQISPKTFCKWHRMVFQDSCHPTLAQAAAQMKYYSNRDLREVQRIARLLPDEQIFGSQGKGGRKKVSTKYSAMWQTWLENKGVDVVIVFE